MCVPGFPECQKRILYLVESDVGAGNQTLGLLEEQPMLWTAEPSCLFKGQRLAKSTEFWIMLPMFLEE